MNTKSIAKKYTTIALIIVLGIVSLIFISLLFRNAGASQTSVNMEEEALMEEEIKKANLYFSPQLAEVSEANGQTIVVDLSLATFEASVTGVQVELYYDSSLINDMEVVVAADEESYFGEGANVLFNEVNEEAGTISFAVAVGPNSEAVSEDAKIATLTFTTSLSANESSTNINFLESFVSTVAGEQIEVEVSPLTVGF